MNDLKAKTIKSIKWSFFTETSTKAIQPITILILTRLLTPEDFGLVGVASIFIGLAQIFQDFGLGKALIQRDREVEKTANIVFWTNLFIGILLCLLIIILTPKLVIFFQDNRLADVLRILSIEIVLMSLITVHQSLLQRGFFFKHLFLIRLTSGIVSALVSIPMACMGYGVWSLVSGTLGGTFCQVIIFWVLSNWKPKLEFDFSFAKKIYSFSLWVLLEAFLSWIILWGDSASIGYFLGINEVGVYRVGVIIVIFVFGLVFNPIVTVAYSFFSRLQSNMFEIRQNLLLTTKFIAIISFPMGLCMVFLSKPLVMLFFGDKWAGLEVVIALLSIVHSIAWLVGINPEVYRAIGRPDVNTKFLTAIVIYYVPAYIFAAQYGLYVFCIFRLLIAIVAMFLHFFVTKRLVGLPYSYVIDCSKKPFLACVPMGLLIILYNYFIQPKIIESFLYPLSFFVMISIAIVIYIFMIRLIDSNSFVEMKIFLSNLIKKD